MDIVFPGRECYHCRRMRGSGPEKVTDHVYLVGSSDITDARDCSVYVIDAGELVLIDTGAGVNAPQIVRNIELAGLDTARLSTVILTHNHIDHIGGAQYIRDHFQARIVIHELDAPALEQADLKKTGASWYNLRFNPLKPDRKLTGKQETLTFGDLNVNCLHTPGHTPGSISVYVDVDGQRILFGQDIHGPFLPEFGADLSAWRRSMGELLALDADVLCEGHFGVYRPKARVRDYIEGYLDEYA